MEITDILTSVNGKPITVEDVLIHLKACGTFRNAILELIELEVIESKAAELGITLSEDELYAYTENQRASMGLSDTLRMNEYCSLMGITMDQWYTTMEKDLLRIRLMERLIDQGDIEASFEGQKERLKTVSTSRIVCADQQMSEELSRLLNANPEEFSPLARKHSLEQNTRVAGGYVGNIQPGMLPEEIEERLFQAGEGELVGPLWQNGYWVLYRVEHITHQELNSTMTTQIRESLFQQWLEREVYSAKV